MINGCVFIKNSADNQDIEAKFYPGFSGVKYDKTAKWETYCCSFNTRV